MSRFTYRVEYAVSALDGEPSEIYFRKLTEARREFKQSDKATALYRVWLAPDAFERAFNGGGGFVEHEQLLAERGEK